MDIGSQTAAIEAGLVALGVTITGELVTLGADIDAAVALSTSTLVATIGASSAAISNAISTQTNQLVAPLNNIYSLLDRMANKLDYMYNRLSDIDTNVDSIKTDVGRLININTDIKTGVDQLSTINTTVSDIKEDLAYVRSDSTFAKFQFFNNVEFSAHRSIDGVLHHFLRNEPFG